MSDVILYTTDDGKTKIDLHLHDDNVWLSQLQIAELFQTTKQNISKHIRAIYDDQELDEQATVNQQLTVQKEGNREVSRSTTFYNLDMILAIGYRVRSPRGVQFRRYASTVLKEYLKKGFAMNDDRLKNLGGGSYWKELLDRTKATGERWENLQHAGEKESETGVAEIQSPDARCGRERLSQNHLLSGKTGQNRKPEKRRAGMSGLTFLGKLLDACGSGVKRSLKTQIHVTTSHSKKRGSAHPAVPGRSPAVAGRRRVICRGAQVLSKFPSSHHGIPSGAKPDRPHQTTTAAIHLLPPN